MVNASTAPPQWMRGSAIADGSQIIVRLDDLPQPVLAGPVTAVGIGVMPLHQQLEPSLDIGRGHLAFKPKGIERLAFGIPYHSAFSEAIALRPRPPPKPELIEHPERIRSPGNPPSDRVGAGRRRLAIDPDLPGRSVSSH